MGRRCVFDSGYNNMEIADYSVVYDSTKPFCCKSYNGEKVIVSLTSWKKRIELVHETINSILKVCKNVHIVLVLSHEEFPEMEKCLPKSLLGLLGRMEILWVERNIKAFKKVMPTMCKYKNVPIVSADDDCLYIKDYVSELYALYSSNRNFATYSYRHDKMVTNCGAATLYNPVYYDLICGMFNYSIPNLVLEDDMYMQYVIDFNNLSQCFAKTSFPFVSNKKNEICALHDKYSNGVNCRIRKTNYYKIFDSIMNAEVVVNVTTWRKRDWCLPVMLSNLKKQTRYPDKIILWLSEEEYDRNNLPESIRKCVSGNLLTDIMWVKKNTKGHKRYECFKYFDDCYNILLDDDVLYKPDFIKELVSESKMHQDCITVYSSYSVSYDGFSVIKNEPFPYPSLKNLFIAGRCCFPPHIFPKDAYENESLRNEYVLNCDESWYRPFFIKNDIKINVMYKWSNSHYPVIQDSQKFSLWNINENVLENGMRDKERNFYNAIKIANAENNVKMLWPKIGIDNWSLRK